MVDHTSNRTSFVQRASTDWLVGGGEMGSLIRSMDWSSTPLGPIESWPQSLRSALSILLPSKAQIALFWGPELITLYNDAYRPVFGGKHPHALGQPIRDAWAELWRAGLKELFENVLTTGEAFWAKDRPFYMERHGYPEETFFDVSYDPVRDETGRVGGVFCIVSEQTARVVGERRLKVLRDLGVVAAQAHSAAEAWALSAEVLATAPLDIPFVDADLEDHAEWPLGLQQVADMKHCMASAPGPWPEPASSVMVLPLGERAGDSGGKIALGVSSRLAFDDHYRDFFQLVARQIAASIATARAAEDERRRAEALAEIDRAKTAFFSNVSHEFRTPLTLMLGPLEDTLARSKALPPADREQLETVHRNSLRLLKLVNTLLDFSRIEAGRVQAVYEPTDLAAATTELASVFRSAVEKAGLKLVVDCPPLSEPAYVDRDMWEKIVLNLISNAFKFTFDGDIEVRLRESGETIVLAVRDTGTGIPSDELPKLFERFHRVAGAHGRTHEGSGIGLALVQELAKLHGGSVSVDSVYGDGSTFNVTIPKGFRHLPAEQIGAARTQASTALGATPFVEEALRWLPDAALEDERVIQDIEFSAATETTSTDRPRILLADDNADMRDYVRRLLASRYDVEAVGDGEAALAAMARNKPDLVLSDIMMPRLDGMQLLARLRADPQTSTIPIILLSARAGEESRVEGMQAGADDYLIKPFSARELLARVEAHVKMSRFRGEITETLRASEERFRAFVTASSDVVYRMSPDWSEMRYLQGRDFIPDTQNANRAWLAKYIHPEDQPHVLEAINEAIRSRSVFELEHRVIRVDGTLGWTHSRAIPLLGSDGEIVEWFGAARDITDPKQAEQALRQSEERYRQLANLLPVAVYTCDATGVITYYNHQAARLWGRAPAPGDTDERFCGSQQLVLPNGEVLPHDECPMALALKDGSSFREEPVDIRRPEGTQVSVRVNVDPIRDNAGRIVGAINVFHDVTDLRRAEEAQQLLVAELNHRVKNTLASVQAIAQHTLRRSRDPQQFVESFTGRIQSLARVHSLLTATTWQKADLRDLIRDQLLHGSVDDSRITARGPAVLLESQMAMHVALMLHELGTNANKYGAFSAASGRVSMTWTVDDETLQIKWEERGGPEVAAPAARGFGTTLIERSAQGAGGWARMSVKAEGIVWEIELPLPRGPAPADTARPVPEATAKTSAQRRFQLAEAPGQLAGKRFLVVEDEPLVALDIVANLEDAGADVAASTGSVGEALELIQSKALDAALLDGNLHGHPVDRIAAALTRRGVPFLFVTGYGRESLPQAFQNTAMLVKPFSQRQLVEACVRLVEETGDVVRLRER